MENQDQFKYLYDRYLANQATPEETDQLFLYIANEKNSEQLKEMLGATWDQLQVAPGSFNIRPVTLPEKAIAPVRRMFSWRKIAVAASIIVILGLGSYFTFFNNKADQQPVANNQQPSDVQAPQNTKATITLADGRIVTLDSAVSGTLATQGNVKLIKLTNGQIAYETASGEIIKEIKYNTLQNPRGSKVIDMTLADGSRVWLNAGSSVTYPVAFIGNERKVSITGEAYFEVSHNANKPFKVSKGDMEVTVLGTHFNVNAYDDESDIKVTLLEGSVKVSKSGQAVTIKPGEQARLTSNLKPQTSNAVSLEQVMAWKNGNFNYQNSDLETIMRQMARWYDVEVIYQAKITDRYTVDVSRNVPVSELFKYIEMSGGVRFKIEGKKVTVTK